MIRNHIIKLMEGYKGADRLAGFDKPRVWTVLTPLGQQLGAANLVFIHL